jgi:hypothetical protein
LIYEYKRKILGLNEWTGRNRFTMLLAKDERFARWNLLPSMLRPSALMDADRSDEVQMPVAQALADHQSRNMTANSYVGKTPARILAYLEIREFQEQYQAVTLLTDGPMAEALGFSNAEIAHIFSDAARTGMGVACRDSRAGVQPGTRRGEDCHRLELCSGCQQRYVVATEENFVDIVVVNRYVSQRLDVADEAGLSSQETLMRFKAFTDAVIDKASQGSSAGMLARAKAIADSVDSGYLELVLGK